MPAMHAADSAATTPRTRSASARARRAAGTGEEGSAAPAMAPGSTAASGADDERPARRWLETARLRFAGEAGKEPVTSAQLAYLLDLLHEDGQDRRLVSETYGYLDRGMSKAHATVQIRKLRGEFREGARAA